MRLPEKIVGGIHGVVGVVKVVKGQVCLISDMILNLSSASVAGSVIN